MTTSTDNQPPGGLEDRPRGPHDPSLDDVAVPLLLSEVLPAVSARMSVKPEYVHELAVSDLEWPPIIVHRRTARIIDGLHRFHAAKVRKLEEIDALWYHGDDDEAFLLSVRANTQTGFPLSWAERAIAVRHIRRVRPYWPLRMVARTVCLPIDVVESLTMKRPA